MHILLWYFSESKLKFYVLMLYTEFIHFFKRLTYWIYHMSSIIRHDFYDTELYYLSLREKNPLLIKHAMDCKTPSSLSNVEMWRYFPSFFHTYSLKWYLFSPFKDNIKEGENTKKDTIQGISLHLALTVIFRYYLNLTIIFRYYNNAIKTDQTHHFELFCLILKKLPQKTQNFFSSVRELIPYNYKPCTKPSALHILSLHLILTTTLWSRSYFHAYFTG